MKLFGFEISRTGSKQQDYDEQPISFAEPLNDDGALTIGAALGGSYSMLLDMEGSAKSEAELVTKYRTMSMQPEIQQAIEEVVNEAINVDDFNKVVEVVLDDVELTDRVKKLIIAEFEQILGLLNFSNDAYDIFAKWYVDGRLNYHVIIDENNIDDGIQEIRYVDPRKIRLIREVTDQVRDPQTGALLKKVVDEYFVYSESGFGTTSTASSITQPQQQIVGLRIAKESVVRVTSGLMNENNTLVLSHLHKAIKPLNQLRMLEDATVIYTLTRAPERRVFYIDVGNLPKAKAEQYLQDMMTRHKNKLQYDSTTGEITDARKFMTMTEDFWFPRREGNRATEIESLTGGTALQDNANLDYFLKKLYKSLAVPASRLDPENHYTLGRSTEITREELKFAKFIRRLRARFSILFDECLRRQLILKNIITPDEWEQIRNKIRYDFQKDNYFEELKNTEILRERLNTLNEISPQVGIYYSKEWVVKNVLQLSDDDYKQMQKQIDQETAEGVPTGNEQPDGEDGDFEQPPTQPQQPEQVADEQLTIKQTSSKS